MTSIWGSRILRYKKLHIGVSGARGFLGQALSTGMSLSGHHFVGFSRDTSTGFFSLADDEVLARCEAFIHLGEPANVHIFNANPHPSALLTSETAVNLADRFAERLIYASSSLVYGTKSGDPQTASAKVFPQDAYSEMKLRNEEIVLERGGLVMRLSNVFGFGMSPETVIPRLVRQVSSGKIIDLKNNPVRDFLHVEDFVSLALLIATNGGSGIFNVGSGVGRSIGDLVKVIAEIQGIEQLTTKVDEPNADYSDCLVLDISRTTETFGWVPSPNFANQITLSITKDVNHDR